MDQLPEWAILITRLRVEKGLTQKQLGELIGSSPQNVTRMEKGQRALGKNKAKQLGEVFKVNWRLFL